MQEVPLCSLPINVAVLLITQINNNNNEIITDDLAQADISIIL